MAGEPEPLSDDWEQAEEALKKLDIKNEEQNGVAGHVDENESSSPAAKEEPSEEVNASQSNGDVEHVVDHALKDALSRHKHRNAVLRLEAEVEDFVLNSTEPQKRFSGEMSSYDRLLVHRTAQHWGLDTSTINQGPDNGCILAIRTPRTGVPAIKLADLPVTMEEPAMPQQAAPAAGPAPKVLVRRRADRPRGQNQSPGGASGPHTHHGGGYNSNARGGSGPHSSIEDRELHYERARARIFGNEGGAGGGGPAAGYPAARGGIPMMHPQMMAYPQMQMQMQHMQQQQQQQHRGSSGGGGYGGSNSGASGPAAANTSANGPSARGSGTATGSTKAQLRNRQEDLSDPDFRRGRHGTGPRFDPGFGEDPSTQGGMYIRPTYGSEFPELGGPGGHYPASPPTGMPMYPAAMMHPQMAAQMQYGYSHQGMMAAAAPGMMGGSSGGPGSSNAGGGSAASGSGNASAAAASSGYPTHPMYAQGTATPMQYHPGGYAVAMSPYGYVSMPMPVRTGADGSMVPTAMMPMMYTTAGPGMYQHHPGSPPMGMAMSPSGGGGGMMGHAQAPTSPGSWQQQQQHHQQQGRGGQQQLQRNTSGRSRNSGAGGGKGGAGVGGHSNATTPRADGASLPSAGGGHHHEQQKSN